MHGHAAGLRRLDGLIWALVALVAVLVLTVSAARGFTVEFRSFAAPGLTCLLLGLGARSHRDRRNEPKLASALESTAQIMAFAAVAAPLSYVAASLGLPLQDAMFDSLDRALGLNWRSMLAFIERWPEFSSFLRVMYLSLTVQMTSQPAWYADYAASREEADPGSVLHLYRAALRARRTIDQTTPLTWVEVDRRGVLAFRRGDLFCVTVFDVPPYGVPAEWGPQAATWLAGPHKVASWPGKRDRIQPSFAAMARAPV